MYRSVNIEEIIEADSEQEFRDLRVAIDKETLPDEFDNLSGESGQALNYNPLRRTEIQGLYRPSPDLTHPRTSPVRHSPRLEEFNEPRPSPIVFGETATEPPRLLSDPEFDEEDEDLRTVAFLSINPELPEVSTLNRNARVFNPQTYEESTSTQPHQQPPLPPVMPPLPPEMPPLPHGMPPIPPRRPPLPPGTPPLTFIEWLQRDIIQVEFNGNRESVFRIPIVSDRPYIKKIFPNIKNRKIYKYDISKFGPTWLAHKPSFTNGKLDGFLIYYVGTMDPHGELKGNPTLTDKLRQKLIFEEQNYLGILRRKLDLMYR
jgi:hypothetical protein